MAAGHVVARLSGASTDGYSHPYIAAVTYGSALYGFFALGLTFLIYTPSDRARLVANNSGRDQHR